MISLKQLRYFSAVARLGHFGKAADACAVTQPALSMQIQELEHTLGVQLIERRPRAISLTPQGEEVAARAARILAEVRDLKEFASLSQAPLSGVLHLGVIPTIAPYVLPPLLPLLRERYPQLDLSVRETQTATLTAELLDGSLDVLLLALPIEQSEIETLALIEDRFLLALPASHQAAENVLATPDLVKDCQMLLLEEGHCLRDQALAYCHTRNMGKLDVYGASSLSTVVQLVAGGMGVTLVPEISAALETRHAAIRLLRFETPEPRRMLGLAWRASSARRRDFEALGEVIIAALADAVQCRVL